MYMYMIWIGYENCIILHFYNSCHITEKCVEFWFLKHFCCLVRNENTKKTWFPYGTSNRRFLEFYSAKTTKQNEEYV